MANIICETYMQNIKKMMEINEKIDKGYKEILVEHSIDSIIVLRRKKISEKKILEHIISLITKGELQIDKLFERQNDLRLSGSIFTGLGIAYGRGEKGLRTNKDLAFQLYKFAADKLKDPPACVHCAQYCLDGWAPQGCDLSEAMKYCDRAARYCDRSILLKKIYSLSRKILEAQRTTLLPLLNFSNNFNLVFGSKKKEKICRVESEKLHQMDTSLGYEAHKVFLSRNGYSRRYNYLLGRIGFRITDKRHQKGGSHKRIFKMTYIFMDNKNIYCDLKNFPHTELQIFDYLLNEENLNKIIESFKREYGIDNENRRKVYSVVLDFHSLYDMCQNCFSKTGDFLKKFRKKILVALSNNGFKLPKEGSRNKYGPFFIDQGIADNRHFQVILNFSSSRDYNDGIRKKSGQKPLVKGSLNFKYANGIQFFHGTNKWHGYASSEVDKNGFKNRTVVVTKWACAPYPTKTAEEDINATKDELLNLG